MCRMCIIRLVSHLRGRPSDKASAAVSKCYSDIDSVIGVGCCLIINCFSNILTSLHFMRINISDDVFRNILN